MKSCLNIHTRATEHTDDIYRQISYQYLHVLSSSTGSLADEHVMSSISRNIQGDNVVRMTWFLVFPPPSILFISIFFPNKTVVFSPLTAMEIAAVISIFYFSRRQIDVCKDYDV